MLLLLKLDYLADLVGVLLLHLQKHLPHLGKVHARHLSIQGLVVAVKGRIQMDAVALLFTLSLQKGVIVLADVTLVLHSRRVGLIRMTVLFAINLLT
jgi:hypothetical protein